MFSYKPVVLVVLDGWGESKEIKGNPIKAAKLPTIEKLNQYYPKILLQASGISVGLPWKENGNSEVGHQAMGSGQIVYQNLPRINMAIENGSFYENQILVKNLEEAKQKGVGFHLMGLFSDGAVHAHLNHFFAVLEMAKEIGYSRIYLHLFLDGRDTPPQSAKKYLVKLQEKLDRLQIGKIASLGGRFFGMDRNNNWDRIEKAFQSMTEKEIVTVQTDPLAVIEKQYQAGITDENIPPVTLTDSRGKPIGPIEEGDYLFFLNFREDRARQITKAFVMKDFDHFSPKTVRPHLGKFIAMVEYEKKMPIEEIVFPPQEITSSLGETLATNKKRQLRIAETEKYAHVTYFFNGGKDQPFPGEDHLLIPSKNVPSYAEVPEMSANEITERLTMAIEKDKYDFILVNYANADMVGHTGDFDACIKALETLDENLSRLIPVVLKKNGCLLITADHGNVEDVYDEEKGDRETEHSNNPVPLWWVTADNHFSSPINNSGPDQAGGVLSDLAPTVLELMNLETPSTMKSHSLLPLLKK